MAKEESLIAKQIADYVNSLEGFCVWRNQSGKVQIRGGWMYLSPKGTPDLVGYTGKGQFLGIEIKTLTGKVNPEQIEFRNNCKGLCILARCVDDVKKVLNEITKAE